MNAREAFKKTIATTAGPERPVFVPLVYRLAARIDQTPLMDAAADATVYANLLEGAWKLLRQDAITLSFDETLEAEVFGAMVDWPGEYEAPAVTGWLPTGLTAASIENSFRWSVLIEVTKRLVQTRGRDTAILGVVTGPVSLAALLKTHTGLDREYSFEELVALAGGLLAKEISSFGETKVDGIILREDPLGENYFQTFQENGKACRDAYTTLFNLTRFYNQAGLLLVRGGGLDDLASLAEQAGPAGLVLTGLDPDDAALQRLADLSAARKMAVGLPLPFTEPAAAEARLQRYEDFIRQHPAPGFFYTSDGELPPEVPMESIRDLTGRLTGFPNQTV